MELVAHSTMNLHQILFWFEVYILYLCTCIDQEIACSSYILHLLWHLWIKLISAWVAVSFFTFWPISLDSHCDFLYYTTLKYNLLTNHGLKSLTTIQSFFLYLCIDLSLVFCHNDGKYTDISTCEISNNVISIIIQQHKVSLIKWLWEKRTCF